MRERRSVNAEGYVTVERPGHRGAAAGKRAAEQAAVKFGTFSKLWELAVAAVTGKSNDGPC